MEELTDRKQKILKAVVDEYIVNPSPVSSGEIKAKHFDDISSATIRNELSALEEMGYLIQPHTSAGRIPSKKAYNLYVDKFLVKHRLSKQEIKVIEDAFRGRFHEVTDIVKRTAQVISDVTNYTSVIVLKNINKVLLKEIKLVGLDSHTVLVVIITDSGIIRDKVISLHDAATDSYLTEANLLLNQLFGGRTVGEIPAAEKSIDQHFIKYKELYDNIISIIARYSEGDANDVYLSGQSKFLEYPGQDVATAKDFLDTLDTKERLTELIDDRDIEFSVKIGKDEQGGIENCAVVTARYKIKGKDIGHAGVIGPERMDYSKVMSVLEYIGKTLDEITDGGKNGRLDEKDGGRKPRGRDDLHN